MKILAGEPYAFSLMDIASMLMVPKGSAHRFMKVLIDSGFVEQDRATRRYMLTGQALWVGTSYLRNSAVHHCALSVLAQLSDDTRTTSHLAVWDNGAVLILHTAGPPEGIHMFVDVGLRCPAHATALGKVLLAYRPASELKRICESSLAPITPRTITSPVALEEDLSGIRESGIAFDNEESALGLRCMAAPVRNQTEVVAALGIVSDCRLITEESLPRFAQLVQQAALLTSVRLGYRPATTHLTTVRNTLDGGAPLETELRSSREREPGVAGSVTPAMSGRAR